MLLYYKEEKPRPRKDITPANYVIEDYLQGLSVTRGEFLNERKVVGPDAAIPQLPAAGDTKVGQRWRVLMRK